jgi:hypothetical protein
MFYSRIHRTVSFLWCALLLLFFFCFCLSGTQVYVGNDMYDYFITLFLVVNWSDRVIARFDL